MQARGLVFVLRFGGLVTLQAVDDVCNAMLRGMVPPCFVVYVGSVVVLYPSPPRPAFCLVKKSDLTRVWLDDLAKVLALGFPPSTTIFMENMSVFWFREPLRFCSRMWRFLAARLSTVRRGRLAG